MVMTIPSFAGGIVNKFRVISVVSEPGTNNYIYVKGLVDFDASYGYAGYFIGAKALQVFDTEVLSCTNDLVELSITYKHVLSKVGINTNYDQGDGYLKSNVFVKRLSVKGCTVHGKELVVNGTSFMSH